MKISKSDIKVTINELVNEIMDPNPPSDIPPGFFGGLIHSLSSMQAAAEDSPQYKDPKVAHELAHASLTFLLKTIKSIVHDTLHQIKKYPPTKMDLKKNPRITLSKKNYINKKYKDTDELRRFKAGYSEVETNLNHFFSWWCMKYDKEQKTFEKRLPMYKEFSSALDSITNAAKDLIAIIIENENYALAKNMIDKFDGMFQGAADKIDELFSIKSTKVYRFRSIDIKSEK